MLTYLTNGYMRRLCTSLVSAANLCVSYIMTSQNEDAEELMRRIEKEEERVGFGDGETRQPTFHLCIVNLGAWGGG